MPNLRSMLDGTTLYAAGIAPPVAPPPGNAMPLGNSRPPKNTNQANQPGGKATKGLAGKGKNGKASPAAQHVLSHLGDPLGATKEGFTDLTQKKSDYDNARAEMQRELTMPQAVIDHVAQIHGLVPGGQPGQIPTPGMTPAQGQPGQIDPATGQPMDPNQDPNNPGGNDNPDMDPVTGNPTNMSQKPGQINQNRPSMAGHQPGVSPGPAQSVVPGKMGMPQPGGQVNKQAAKPKGNNSIPGAKGPGDPKVGNKTKQAQGNSSRQVKISVAASSSSGLPVIHASRTIESTFGLASLSVIPKRIADTLRSAGTSHGAKKHWSVRNKGPLSQKEKDAHYGTMKSNMMVTPGSPGSGRMSPGSMRAPARGGPISPSGMRAKKMKAGPAALSDKVSDSGAELSYNPTGSAPEMNASKVLDVCAKCGKSHSKSMDCSEKA